MKLKKFFLTLSVLLTAAVTAKTQTFYICYGSDVTAASEISFSNNGATLNGSMQTTDIDSITTHVPAMHFVGGDISMLTEYEKQKANFLDGNGKKIDNLLTFLKEQGWNAVRLRLFVDPTKTNDPKQVFQDIDYVKALGKRIKDEGMLLMLDFHYSDTWADPAAQWTPDSWLTLTDAQLYEKIYTYTKECLQAMNAAGASPDFIQTGNEISYGMLWGAKGSQSYRCYMGNEANWPRFTTLLKQAGKACREVCPQAKIIVHTERAGQTDVLKNFYQQMNKYGVDYDIIGLSYYPYYHGTQATISSSLSMLENNFAGKPIMIVETGCAYRYKMGDRDQGYALTNEGQRQFTADLITMLKKHPAVNGLFWWYPEANAKGCTGNLNSGWYNAGLFDNSTGCALPALYELKSFK